MRYDLFNLMQKRDDGWGTKRVLDNTAEHVKLAEALGFETAWFAEHHLSNYCLMPSPLMACAYFAPMTETIRLGPAVIVAPLYNPVRVAQEIALLDVMSNGRLKVGIGSGYQDYEFDRFGVKLAESIPMTMEMLDIIELALTRDSFAYEGRHYRIPETGLAIKPIQKPLPEIWFAGLNSRPEVQDRIVASGYCPMNSPAWMPVSFMGKARAAYDARLRVAGRDPATAPFGIQRFIHVTEDKGEARDAAERARYSSRLSQSLTNNTYKFDGIYIEEEVCDYEPPLEACLENYIIGGVEHCVETLLRDQETINPSHILCTLQLGGIPHERVTRTLEKLGTEIIPAVEKELARRGAPQPIPVRQQPMLAQAAE